MEMKQYAYDSRNAKPSELRNRRENKLTPAFDHRPYTVVGRKGSVISAKKGERVVARNSSFFEPVLSDATVISGKGVTLRLDLGQIDRQHSQLRHRPHTGIGPTGSKCDEFQQQHRRLTQQMPTPLRYW